MSDHHEHSEVFAALRAQHRAQEDCHLDFTMWCFIANEPNSVLENRADYAKGRAFAAEIARMHGVAGVQSLYRCLVPHFGRLIDDDDDIEEITAIVDHVGENSLGPLMGPRVTSALDEAIAEQIKGRSQAFITAAVMFCELSGVER